MIMKPNLNAADIELLQKYFATKEDIKVLSEKTVSHDQLRYILQETKQEIIDEIATVVAKSILPTQESHERRITALENHTNLPTSK